MDRSPSARDSDPAGRLVIVCGLPGSGKTTLAKRLESAYAAVRLCPDDWMAALAIDLFAEATRTRIEQLQWQLAQRILQLGGAVVIEWGTWGYDERDALRRGARALGAVVELRLLDEPIDVLWERIRARDMERALGARALTREDIAAYAASFQRPDAEELALYTRRSHRDLQATPASAFRCGSRHRAAHGCPAP